MANLEMFTPQRGVAVATEAPSGGPEPVHLLATVDGGLSWSVTGTLPVRMTEIDLVTTELAFEGAEAGYLAVVRPLDRSNAVLYTADGGARWRTVTTPGSPAGISLADDRLWVVSDVCPGGDPVSTNCKSELLTYRFGALHPTAVTPVPDLTADVAPSSHLLRRLGPTAAVFTSDGTAAYPHDLVLTTDAGRSWKPLTDPCRKTQMAPSGLVATASNRWLLLCQVDGGMENYSVRLYGTGDSGTSWQLVAEHNVTRELPQIGSVVPGFSFTVSGDGRTLWLLGPAGGVSWSRDGGLDWTGLPSLDTGGGFHDLVAAGASEAWFALPWQGLYFTQNGTSWRRLS